MKFRPEDLPYLSGEKFSNGRVFSVAKYNSPNIDRLSFLEELVRGKKIIHLGFTDHIPLIERKIRKGKWLHKRLTGSAHRCAGIDINLEAVNFISEKYAFPDLFCFDITRGRIPEEIQSEKWDYLILGEVLEHIDNPVDFLQKIHNRCRGMVKQIVVTVPNAFDLNNLTLLFRNKEFINTDHRFWFTPYTLAKVIMQAGFRLGDFYCSQTYFPKRWWKRQLLKRFPLLRETTIMTAEF
jgi:hypothetical protein